MRAAIFFILLFTYSNHLYAGPVVNAAVDDIFDVVEDSIDNFLDVLANDITTDQTEVISVTVATTSGLARINPGPNGGIVFTPRKDFFGQLSLTYEQDDLTEPDPPTDATVVLRVYPVNDPPSATTNVICITTMEDTMVRIPIGDVVTDDGPLRGRLKNPPSHGLLRRVDDAGLILDYQPAGHYFGQDMFTYTVADGEEESVDIDVVVDITEINDHPIAVNDVYNMIKDRIDTILDVLENDIHPTNEGETLTVTSVGTTGTTGSVTPSPGGVTYRPALNYTGPDSFTYTVSDGANTATGLVQVTVHEFLPLALFTDQTVSISEDKGTNGVDIVVTVNRFADSDGTTSVSYSTSNSTATAGSDYIPTSGVLVFGPNDYRKKITIFTIADQDPEPDEEIIVRLHDPVNAIVTQPGISTIIRGDDAMAELSVTFSELDPLDPVLVDPDTFTKIPIGEPYLMDVIIKDLRPNPPGGIPGVDEAFVDIVYPRDALQVINILSNSYLRDNQTAEVDADAAILSVGGERGTNEAPINTDTFVIGEAAVQFFGGQRDFEFASDEDVLLQEFPDFITADLDGVPRRVLASNTRIKLRGEDDYVTHLVRFKSEIRRTTSPRVKTRSTPAGLEVYWPQTTAPFRLDYSSRLTYPQPWTTITQGLIQSTATEFLFLDTSGESERVYRLFEVSE